MKQQLRYGTIINLSVLSLLLNIHSKAYGTQKQVESNSPATTIKQWQSRPRQSLFVGNQQDRAVSQLNNSPAIITKIELRSTASAGIEIVVNTANGETLQGITSTEKNNLIIDIPNAQLQLSEPRFVRQNPVEGISTVTATALSGNRVRVIISGVEGTPTGEIVRTAQGLNIAVISPIPLANTDTPPDQVIDIIVTAQKQPERLQDVPISLTNLSQQEIEDAKIDSFRDVAANTPNFFTTVSDRAFNFQTIRGLGNANFLSRDSISFFIDDVPYENVHQLLPGALFDLERVEVLRGPQSTLYGRNSQAGVVNVISRPPTDSLEFTLGASYGDFNERQVQFSVSDAVVILNPI